MDGTVTLAIALKKIKATASGVKNIQVGADNKSLIFTLNDASSTQLKVNIPNPINNPVLLNKITLDTTTNELLFDGDPICKFTDDQYDILKKFGISPEGKLLWDNKTVGSGEAGAKADWVTNVSVGSLNSGVNLTDMTALEILKKITRKYTNANATVTWSETNTLLEVGDSINLNVTVSNFVSGDYAPSKVALYRGTTLLEEKTASGTVTFSTVNNITTDTTFTVKLTDANNIVTSISTKTYEFISASYTGLVSAIPTVSADITALTKLVRKKAPYTNTYAPANQYIVFCYPQSYGNLTSVLDGNGFENLGEYSKSVITINSIAYNVYCTTSKLTSTGLKYTFKY